MTNSLRLYGRSRVGRFFGFRLLVGAAFVHHTQGDPHLSGVVTYHYQGLR